MARLALLALLIGACATNPVTGERELILVSPEREAEMGRAAAEQVAQEMGLVESPALVAYVEAIGARLASVSPLAVQYRFHAVDMPEPNAFALPGGYIYVSRGLLALANSEDELANVMAHEVAHVAARHSAQRQTRATGIGLLSVLGTIAAAVAGGAEAAQTVGQLGQLAGAGLIASYGRDQEREADRVGQALAAQQGWDPAAMSAFLRSLERDAALRSGGVARNPSFFDSHPATPERVATTAARARELAHAPLPPVARGRAEFLARIEGTLVGPNPAEGVLDGQDFTHPDLDLHLSFPAGWTVVNARAFVGARNEEGSAVLKLELAAEGSDPEAAARELVRETGLQVVDQGARSIGGLPAYRVVGVARSQQGDLAVDLVCIGHGGRVYVLSGVTPAGLYSQHRDAFARTAQSFRPLRPEERAAVRETRLRIATARAGETLAQLASRTGNTWSEQETAVANALDADVRLGAGQLVKIAVARPYATR